MATRRSDAASAVSEQSCSYALKVAYLVHLLKPEPLTHSASTSSSSTSAAPTGGAPNVPDKTPWRNSLSSSSPFASIGDLFRDVGSSSKSNKYPEKLVKVLGNRIQAIATHQDPVYSDPLFRSVIGAFYGTYNQPSFLRQIKENRKVEEIILSFVTSSQNVLRRRAQGDEWKSQLMETVHMLVCLIRDCLRSKEIRNVSPELMQRLDMYITKLSQPPPEPRRLSSHSQSTSSYEQSFSSTSPQIPFLVDHVARVFGLSEAQLAQHMRSIEKECTVLAASKDLKQTLKAISQGEAPFDRRQDFNSDAAYQAWRKSELEAVQKLLLNAISKSPDIMPNSSSNDSETTSSTTDFTNNNNNNSNINRSSSSHTQHSYLQNSTEEEYPASSYTFVPPWPRVIYHHLHVIFLNYDLNALRHLPAEEEVSVKILSKPSQEFLHECATRWRVNESTQSAIHFNEICERYNVDAIPLLQCVEAAYKSVEKVASESSDFHMWPRPDQDILERALQRIFDTLLRRVYEFVKEYESVDLDDVLLLASIFESVRMNPLFEQASSTYDIDSRIQELHSALIDLAAHWYLEWTRSSTVYPVGTLPNLLDSLTKILSTTKTLKKKFKIRILDDINPPALFVEKSAALFVADLHSVRDHLVNTLINEDSGDPGYEDEFRTFYFRVLDLLQLHRKTCPRAELSLELAWVFEPYVQKWMDRTDSKTLEWVGNAIGMDKFIPEGSDRHSSSIIDLMDSCNGAVGFVKDLGWPDPVVNAYFMTRLSKTISKSIEEYCNTIENLFSQEVFNQDPNETSKVDSDETRHAWIVKAKGLYAGNSKPESFEFKPESCVKLNNIQAARSLVDKLYTSMDVDEVSHILEQYPRPSHRQQPSRYLFTIKAVVGEDLLGAKETTSVDPFLTLSDETGHRIAKTRTLYDTPDPRWNETFEIVVDRPKWLAATVYDRNIVEEHDMIGRAFIKLDPKTFGDFLTKDNWLELDRHGRILLRVSMEGEQDDIQFYFGRAFRSLKRSESDMTRMLVDKISPFIRKSVSRSVLRSLVKKPSNYNFEMPTMPSSINMPASLKDLKLEKVTSYFQRTNLNQSEIPPVPVIPPVHEQQDENSFQDNHNNNNIPATPSTPASTASSSALGSKKRSTAQVTDAEIEQAIMPLFDFLNDSLAILWESLNSEAFQVVTTKIWKEILAAIESLLIPPLSDKPTKMKPLSDSEVYISIRWLKTLASLLLHDGTGVPMEDLDNQRYRQLISIPLYYDMTEDQLMMEAHRAVQRQITEKTKRPTRAKSVVQQRNLGTIKRHKKEKENRQDKDGPSPELLLCILRMRPNAGDFLSQQLETLGVLRDEGLSKQATR